MTALDSVRQRIEDRTGHPIRNGSARCPAHDDGSPSLSINSTPEGKVLLHCHAGCDIGAVLHALDLEPGDLFDDDGHRGNGTRPEIVATYDYTDESGELLFQVVRRRPKDFRQRRPNGRGGWHWKLGDTRRVLYRLPQVLAAIEAGHEITVCEGEKDVHAAEGAGMIATTMPMGAGKWRPEHTATLAGATVNIVADNDEKGLAHAAHVATELTNAGCDVQVFRPADGFKDLAEHLGAGLDLEDLVTISDDEAATETTGTPRLRYLATRISDVEPEKVRWLWPGRLPLGKLAVLDGDPDVGKSTLALDIVARVTTGEPMPPGGLMPNHPANVVLMAAEDGLGDTIRPRLDAAGADVTRVHHFDKAPRVDPDTGEVTWKFPSIPEDIDALDALVVDTGAVLVVVDVLMAYLSGKADSYKDQDVRRNLERLADMATRRGCCVLLLRHLRKSRGTALYAGGGSVGIVGLARAGMIAAADPDDETGQRRILARSKGNLAAAWPSLAYTLTADKLDGVARVEWLGEVDTSADQLMVHRVENGGDDTDDAAAVLAQLLGDGPMWVKQVIDAMADAGFSKDQAKRAKAKLKVRSEKFGAPGDAEQGWKWVLASPEGSTKGAKGAASETPPPSHPSLPSDPSEAP